jgi:hypothetical protein
MPDKHTGLVLAKAVWQDGWDGEWLVRIEQLIAVASGKNPRLSSYLS